MNKNLIIFTTLLCLMSVFGIVLAWNEPIGNTPLNYKVLDSSFDPQNKEAVVTLKKIVDSNNNDYFIDLNNKKLAASFAGAIKIGDIPFECGEGVQEGAIKYNASLETLQICIKNEWRDLKNKSIVSLKIIGNHTAEECIDNGGAMVNVEEGKLCFYEGITCPVEWNQYLNYSSTYPATAQGCSVYYDKALGAISCPCVPEPPCITGFHTYQNLAPETCTSIGYYRAGDSGCYKYTQPVTGVGVATVYQIGCY